MARIRTIKPQHWNDKELSKLSLQAHLLWIGLWNFSDDEGIFENDPHLIRSQVFPRRTDIRVEQVTQWLDQLSTARFIIPFAHESIGYYIHRTFKTHQKIDRPQPSKIPPEIIRRLLDESSSNVRPCIVEDSNVKESKGEEEPAPTIKKNSDWNIHPSEKHMILELPKIKSGAVQELFKISKNMDVSVKQIEGLWQVFKLQNFTGEKYYKSANEVFSHFINWCKSQDVKKIESASQQQPGMTSREKKGNEILNA